MIFKYMWIFFLGHSDLLHFFGMEGMTSYEKSHLFTSSADWAMKKPIVLAGTFANT